MVFPIPHTGNGRHRVGSEPLSLTAHEKEQGGLNAGLSLGFTLPSRLSRATGPLCLDCPPWPGSVLQA